MDPETWARRWFRAGYGCLADSSWKSHPMTSAFVRLRSSVSVVEGVEEENECEDRK